MNTFLHYGEGNSPINLDLIVTFHIDNAYKRQILFFTEDNCELSWSFETASMCQKVFDELVELLV